MNDRTGPRQTIDPTTALAIYREWMLNRDRITQRGLAARYRVPATSVGRIITAHHKHTKHLPPLPTTRS